MTISKSSKTIGLVILHNDLRIHDNANLLKASVTCDSLLIVYPKQKLFQPSGNRGQSYHDGQDNKMGQAREGFLYQTLQALDSSLQELGNGLLLIDEQPTGVSTFKQLKQLIDDFKVGHVFVSEPADYDQNQGYKLLAQNMPNTQWYYATTSTLFDGCPTETLPTVFTQFRKQVEKTQNLLTAESDFLISPTPTVLPDMPLMNDNFAKSVLFQHCGYVDSKSHENNTDLEQDTPETSVINPFVGGESQALAHMERYFSSETPQSYKETRNSLHLINSEHEQADKESTVDNWSQTTRFSPWLANGSLSVRVLLNRLRQYEQKVTANDSTYWIWFELLWREYFYWYGNEHGKKLFWHGGINGKNSKCCFYGERFERWKNGNTPYPLVNACMKQLKATGYMSNRGRQLVASCFIHELGLDWRYGASYFEQQLIDYDVNSNWGNWQYLAGVGADPRGSRRFNLAKQTKQYDPNGEFIARWDGESGDNLLDSVDMVDWYV